MARTRLSGLPAPLAVFVGGCAGGALRLAIDALMPDSGTGIPYDIVAINIVGAGALGVFTAWGLARGSRWWTPMVGTGVLGAFTTFSALAVLPWAAESSVSYALGVLAATTVAAVAAAAAGWCAGTGLAARQRRAGSTPGAAT